MCLFKKMVEIIWHWFNGAENSLYAFVLLIEILLHTAIQLFIISSFSIIAVKKYKLRIKHILLSIPVMYFLFMLYAPPSIYLLVYTDEWSFVFSHHRAMPYWKASIYITLQYSIVMLLSALISGRKNRHNNE